MKTIASKVAPNPKEAQFWIDLSADPHGTIQKYYNGKKWIAVVEPSENNSEFNTQVIDILKTLANKLEMLEDKIAEQAKEIDVLKKANSNLSKRIEKLEQFIVTE